MLAKTAPETPTIIMPNRTVARFLWFSKTRQALVKSAAVVTISSALGLIDPLRYRTIGVTETNIAVVGQNGRRKLAAVPIANDRNTAHIRALTALMA